MTLSDLAIRNVKRNFSNYFLYFFSMIFSIVIYYTFKAIEFNSQIAKAAETSGKISSAFTASSVLLIVFVAIFIIYSNSFFTKKRKKEVGLYSLLGVRKRQIAKMLFYENMFMGLLALVFGVAIGTLLSKGFIALLFALMGVSMNIHFEIPMQAVIHTAVVFFVIILYTSLQGYRLIYKFKLIELFRAEKQGEKIPKGSPIWAIIGLIMVGTGYYFAYNFITYLKTFSVALPLMILFFTVGGTYILFHFFSVMLLKRARNKKSGFYNGMNIISTSQLLYRIKGNATSLATIATLCAVTICAIGISVAMYFNVGNMVKDTFPYSYSYTVKDENTEKKVNDTLQKHKDNNAVKHDMKVEMLTAKGFTERVGEKSVPDKDFEGFDFDVLSVSEFNKFAKDFGYPTNIKVEKNETVKLVSKVTDKFKELLGEEEKNIKENVKLKTGKEFSTFSIKEEKPYPVQNTFSDTIVVSDELYATLKGNAKAKSIRVIDVENEKKAKELSADLKKQVDVFDFYSAYSQGMEATGIMIFIGGFLGLVFLLATGSIIYFKQLAEADMDKPSYAILQKVGVTNREMKRSIGKQIGFIFAFPLLVAILHSLFALNTAKTLFMILDVKPIIWSALIYAGIYVGYYFLTVRSYYKIVKK